MISFLFFATENNAIAAECIQWKQFKDIIFFKLFKPDNLKTTKQNWEKIKRSKEL